MRDETEQKGTVQLKLQISQKRDELEKVGNWFLDAEVPTIDMYLLSRMWKEFKARPEDGYLVGPPYMQNVMVMAGETHIATYRAILKQLGYQPAWQHYSRPGTFCIPVSASQVQSGWKLLTSVVPAPSPSRAQAQLAVRPPQPSKFVLSGARFVAFWKYQDIQRVWLIGERHEKDPLTCPPPMRTVHQTVMHLITHHDECFFDVILEKGPQPDFSSMDSPLESLLWVLWRCREKEEKKEEKEEKKETKEKMVVQERKRAVTCPYHNVCLHGADIRTDSLGVTLYYLEEKKNDEKGLQEELAKIQTTLKQSYLDLENEDKSKSRFTKVLAEQYSWKRVHPDPLQQIHEQLRAVHPHFVRIHKTLLDEINRNEQKDHNRILNNFKQIHSLAQHLLAIPSHSRSLNISLEPYWKRIEEVGDLLLDAELSTMDLYLLAKTHSTLNPNNDLSRPEYAQNLIIMTGAHHTQTYNQIFAKLGYEEQGIFAADGDDVCIELDQALVDNGWIPFQQQVPVIDLSQ